MPRVKSAPGHCNFTGPGTYYKRTRAKSAGARLNRNVILSGDADRPYPDRFSVSWHRCQGLFHLRGRRHAGRDQARARDPVLSAVRGGILVFVSGSDAATRQSTLLYGALFGLFCYATFDLTSLSLLKHWTWLVAVVDVCWGSFVTAMSLTAGLLIANRITPLN